MGAGTRRPTTALLPALEFRSHFDNGSGAARFEYIHEIRVFMAMTNPSPSRSRFHTVKLSTCGSSASMCSSHARAVSATQRLLDSTCALSIDSQVTGRHEGEPLVSTTRPAG